MLEGMSDERLSRMTVLNPKATEKVLDRGFASEDVTTRRGAAQNPAAAEPQLRNAVNDADTAVSRAAWTQLQERGLN